jgi:creatinine amidohydrolase
MKYLWGEHTWEDIRDAAEAGAIVVAPFGSTEQHGPMLPLDTDIHIAEKLATEGARRAWDKHGIRCLVLPTFPFGLAMHHMHFAGTITLQPETYVAAIADILRCVVRHGFRKIAVITGHGGNEPALQLGMEKIAHEFVDRKPLRIAYFRGHRDPGFAEFCRELWKDEPSEGQPGIHASRWETSETLADRPHLVKREKMVRPTLRRPTVPEWVWHTHELTESGAFGDPSLARADLGEKVWEGWAEAVADFLKRLADEDPDA